MSLKTQEEDEEGRGVDKRWSGRAKHIFYVANGIVFMYVLCLRHVFWCEWKGGTKAVARKRSFQNRINRHKNDDDLDFLHFRSLVVKRKGNQEVFQRKISQ